LTAGGSSIPEVQRLLAVLVAARPGGRIAEIGTAWGEGARVIAEALPPDATFVTVELDPERFAAAREKLAGTRAEVLNAMWQDVLPERGRDERLVGVEILVTPEMAAIVASRKP
jgi:predicted O-methyltransferase YrrM